MKPYVDLHTHSVFSDGTCTPSEVVRLAHEADLEAVALTDHDTVDGLPEARAAGKAFGIRVINGIEFSLKATVSVHLVALGFRDDTQELQQVLHRLVDARRVRNDQMLERLRGLGYDVTRADVDAFARGVPGRSHIAKVLLLKGYVPSIEYAFRNLLDRGCPAYVPRMELSPEEAIRLVHTKGGKAFVAHLNQIRMPEDEKYAFLRSLADAELDGIEGYYTEYTPEQGQTYRRWASELGLILSGGSDFHGTNKEGHLIGVGNGDLRVPSEVLEAILA